MSLNSADAGFSIFAAIEALALSRTGSGVSAGRCSDAERLILVGSTAGLTRATRPCDSAGECLADASWARFGGARDVAGAVGESGLSGALCGVAAWLAATWSKQPCHW